MKCLCKKDYIKRDIKFEKGIYYDYDISERNPECYCVFVNFNIRKMQQEFNREVWYFYIHKESDSGSTLEESSALNFYRFFYSEKELKLKLLL